MTRSPAVAASAMTSMTRVRRTSSRATLEPAARIRVQHSRMDSGAPLVTRSEAASGSSTRTDRLRRSKSKGSSASLCQAARSAGGSPAYGGDDRPGRATHHARAEEDERVVIGGRVQLPAGDSGRPVARSQGSPRPSLGSRVRHAARHHPAQAASKGPDPGPRGAARGRRWGAPPPGAMVEPDVHPRRI